MNGTLIINGSEREFADGQWPASVAALLDALKIDHATVVAEVDGQVIERKAFSDTALQAGQSVELIRFVGGG